MRSSVGFVVWLHGLQGERLVALHEFEGETGHGGGAMFDGEKDAFVGVAAQIEIGIAPGMEFGGAAQSLAGADVCGSLPGMMHDDDGDRVTAL